jgi:hypothetical protein
MVILRTVLGWSLVAFVGLGLTVNGLFMVVSPRAWFRLPGWFPGRGSLTEVRYGSGWGAVQIRLVGAVFLALPAWAAYDMLFR